MATSKSTREKIVEIVLRDYPCIGLPYGALIAIAKEVGVTRQRVQRVISGMGLSGTRTGHRPGTLVMLCSSCGKESTYAAWKRKGKAAPELYICRACRYVDIPCSNCEKPVRTSIARMTTAIRKGPTNIAANGYTGRRFCDRHCFGVWAGINYGSGAQKRKRDAAAAITG